MFKKENFPIVLFVSASIMALLVFALLFIVFTININSKNLAEYQIGNGQVEKYFIKEGEGMNDPMMTKVPKLSDYLAGPVISSLDPSIGLTDSPVNIVIYSDFKCEYCANQEKNIKKAIGAYKDKVRFIWKDYPEADLASDSFIASIAGRCAQEQGNFWNFHDLIFDREQDLSQTNLTQIARDLDFDMGKFNDCLINQRTRKLVLGNMTEADALGITGIPFMYINDQQISGELSYENMKKIIDLQLEKAEKDGE